METSSTFTSRISSLFEPVTRWYESSRIGGLTPTQNSLAVALAVGIVLVLALVLVIALMPSQRRIVRRRRVRLVKRMVPAGDAAASATETTLPTSGPRPLESRKTRGAGFWATVWILLAVVAFAVSYIATGSNSYCGQSCHAEDARVVTALDNPHEDCIDCHESNPVTGVASRIRMAFEDVPEGGIAGTSTDPDACLDCHRNLLDETTTSDVGLRISHKEIVAGGRSCDDCHVDVGHREGRSFTGGMSRCMSCHDGDVAQRTCETCHPAGSPIATADSTRRSTSSFDYPVIRVAKRDCAGCHVDETECIACHGGFVLPHPADFLAGGHARQAAFGAKEQCFKCHTIMQCGSGKCHQSFSAHNEQTWRSAHQSGTSAACGSCHMSWNGKGDFCQVCH